MTTVDDILQLIDPSDRLRIVKDGKDLFVGYVGVYKLDSEKQLPRYLRKLRSKEI